MTQLQDVRKFIQKGDRAVQVLEELGYTFVDNQKEHPHWVAPVNPQDALKDALKALIDTGIEEGIKARLKDDPRGPNWHLVAPMVGKTFSVRPENIPTDHQLFKYSPRQHFMGRRFEALEIRYHRSDEYTGYAVLFKFNLTAYNPEVVWLPLSAVAFR